MNNVFELILRRCSIHYWMKRSPAHDGNNRHFIFLILLLSVSVKLIAAQENNTTTRTNVTNISSSGSPTISYYDDYENTSLPSEAPSITPTTSSSPTINYDEICPNSADWKRIGRPWEMMEWQINEFGCDDEEVQCSDFGSLGRASLHCCKCRPICCGRCNVTCVINTNSPQQQPSPSPGYKYDFKGNGNSSSSSSSSSWNFRPGPRHGALVIVVFFVSIIWCCNREQRSLRRTRRTMNNRRRQQQNNNSSDDVEAAEIISEERRQLFVSKFHFETVPPPPSTQDENDANKVKYSSPDGMVRENSTAASKARSMKDGETDEPNAKYVEGPVDLENSLKSVISSSASDVGSSYRPFASLKRIPAKGACAICLDGYHPGETICIAVNEACNHVYHQECVVEWLKTNDRCPLCRVDLMK